MPYQFKDKTFPVVQHTEMSPAEMDEVEQLTGLTYSRIKQHLKTCVCEHGLTAHLRFDGEGARLDDISCTSPDCVCDEFSADVPSKVNFALLFISLKRDDPSATWAEVASVPQSEWLYLPEKPENPTPPPPPSVVEE